MEQPENAYQSFLALIKEEIRRSQYQAFQAVNQQLLDLYWLIGRGIYERQQEHGWGKSVVAHLSADLQKEFPGVKGFSVQNLWYMRRFYLEYKDSEKLQPLVGEISWSKHVVIMNRCSDEQQREFYIKMTARYGWSKNVLVHQIEGHAFERYMGGQDNFDKTLEAKYKHQAKVALKDHYNFDFLEISDAYSERELEEGLIRNVRKFLMEMGGDFAFMGNQYKLEVGGEEYFIDLLLYHRRLKCLVAIELKSGAFKSEYAGKMQFYLTSLNEELKTADEHPSIGIIICKEKNRTVVEYALKDMNAPMGVASYTIRDELPENLRSLLPSAEEIARKLEVLTND